MNSTLERKDAPSSLRWVEVGRKEDIPLEGGIAFKYGDRQIAVFNFASLGKWYACDNLCPHKQEMVLARGLIGDKNGEPVVACPMHKRVFSLEKGTCLGEPEYCVQTYPVREEHGSVFLLIDDNGPVR